MKGEINNNALTANYNRFEKEKVRIASRQAAYNLASKWEKQIPTVLRTDMKNVCLTFREKISSLDYMLSRTTVCTVGRQIVDSAVVKF